MLKMFQNTSKQYIHYDLKFYKYCVNSTFVLIFPISLTCLNTQKMGFHYKNNFCIILIC